MPTITNLMVLMVVHRRVVPDQLGAALQSLWNRMCPTAHIIVVIDSPIGWGFDRIVVKHEQTHSEMTVLRCAGDSGSGVTPQTSLQLVEAPWMTRLDTGDIARTDRSEKQ